MRTLRSETTTKLAAGTLPNSTWVAPVNAEPVSVTRVPPVVGPDRGESRVGTGMGAVIGTAAEAGEAAFDEAVAVARATGQAIDAAFVAANRGDALHRAGRTRVVTETRPLEDVNDAIDEVLHGKTKARIVLQP